MENLARLVGRARCGDLDAFAQIVRRFQDMAHGYAYAMLGDFHLAEDAAQEAFINAYLKLPDLREPAAFAPWFRRIVFKHCDRITRRKEVKTVPLDEATPVAADATRRTEMHEEVLEAIQKLPERQREATTLFYIDGYSQNEIAEFLEVPVTTVQKRLYDSRKKLKERMLDMVKETLKNNAPDERFSQKVIAELLERPRLLEIPGHPVREVADAIRAALPDYECFEGEEIIEKTDAEGVYTARENVYHVDDAKVLRSDTTSTVLRAAVGRNAPIHLMAAGRVFRPGSPPDRKTRLNAFHMLVGLCVREGADMSGLKATVERVHEAVLGTREYRWDKAKLPHWTTGYLVSVRWRERWLDMTSCGMLSSDVLTRIGQNPDCVGGFAFGFGLERMAMLKHGLDDMRELWRPPHVPER